MFFNSELLSLSMQYDVRWRGCGAFLLVRTSLALLMTSSAPGFFHLELNTDPQYFTVSTESRCIFMFLALTIVNLKFAYFYIHFRVFSDR